MSSTERSDEELELQVSYTLSRVEEALREKGAVGVTSQEALPGIQKAACPTRGLGVVLLLLRVLGRQESSPVGPAPGWALEVWGKTQCAAGQDRLGCHGTGSFSPGVSVRCGKLRGPPVLG